MAAAVSHNFTMTPGSNQSNDLILSLDNKNQSNPNLCDSLSSPTDSVKSLESLCQDVTNNEPFIDIESIESDKDNINTIINFIHAVKCTINEEDPSKNDQKDKKVKQNCLNHQCALFKVIFLHFKMCFYERKCDRLEVCVIDGLKRALQHWLIICTNKKCSSCKVLNRHKRKPSNYEALAKLERIFKGEEDLTNENICKDRAQLSHSKSVKALEFIIEQIRKDEVDNFEHVSILVQRFLENLMKPDEFIESVNKLMSNIPPMCPCCLSFIQQNACSSTPDCQEIAESLSRNNKDARKQKQGRNSTTSEWVCYTSVDVASSDTNETNISNGTLSSIEKCSKILEQKSSKLTSYSSTTTSTKTSITTTSKTSTTTTKVETNKSVKSSQEIKMDIKENEENMAKVTGSITLCPPRKGFRSMRKGRSGCGGNSGTLTVTLQIRANDDAPNSQENSNRTTVADLGLEILSKLEKCQESSNGKRSKDSSNKKLKNSSSLKLKESPNKKHKDSSKENLKESSNLQGKESSDVKSSNVKPKELSVKKETESPLKTLDESSNKKVKETSIKKPEEKDEESSTDKLKEFTNEEIKKSSNENLEKSTNAKIVETSNDVSKEAITKNCCKTTCEPVMQKEERTLENYQKLSELESFQPLTRPVNPPLGLLKDESIWQTNDQIKERMESGRKLEIKRADEPIMRKMLTREKGLKKKDKKGPKPEDTKVVAEKMVGDKKLEIELTGQRIKYLTGIFRQSLIGILHAIKCPVQNYSSKCATNPSADSATSDKETKKQDSQATTCDVPMCHKYKDFYFRHMPICLEKRSCKEPNCNVENVRLGFQHWLVTCGNVKRCEMCKPLERIKKKRSNWETFEEIKKYLRLNEIIDASIWDSSDNAETVGTIEVSVQCQGESQWTEAQKEKLKEADSSCSKKVRKVILSSTLAAAATKQDAHSPGELCRPYKEIHIDSEIETDRDKSIKIVLVTSEEASLRCYNYVIALMEIARNKYTTKEFIIFLEWYKKFIEVYCDTDTFIKNYIQKTGAVMAVNFITNVKTLRKDMIVDRHKELRKYHDVNMDLCKSQDSNFNFTTVNWPGFHCQKDDIPDDHPDKILNNAPAWVNLNQNIVQEMMSQAKVDVVYMTPIYAKFLNLI